MNIKTLIHLCWCRCVHEEEVEERHASMQIDHTSHACLWGIARAYADLCAIMIPFISLLTYRIAYINVKQPRALSPVYENRVEWVDSRARLCLDKNGETI